MYERTIKPRRAISNAVSDIAQTAGTSARVLRKSVGLASLAIDDLRFEMELTSVTDRKEAVLDDLIEQKRLEEEVKLNGLDAQYAQALADLGL